MSATSRPAPAIFAKAVDLSDGGLAFRIEREKALRMKEILASEPDLTTPALVDADEARGLLIFERMPPIRSFAPHEPTIWFERAGRALALVHSRLELPEDLALTRQADNGREGVVFVHGDFMPGNLGIDAEQLVVFDWGLRPWTMEPYTRATPALDLAAFLGPWLLPLWWDPRLPTAKLVAMLDAYLAGVGPDSATADLARATLEEEVTSQVRRRTGEVRAREPWRQPLGRIKVVVNRRRLERALASYLRR